LVSISGRFHVSQNANNIAFDAKLGGATKNKGKRASLSVLVQTRERGKSTWNKLTLKDYKPARTNLVGYSNFTLTLSDGYASVSKNTEWRIRFEAVYVDRAGTHKKILLHNLLPT
jgi:hypothetical protein